MIISRATAEWLVARGVLQRLIAADGDRLDVAVYDDVVEIRLLAATRGSDGGAMRGTCSAPIPAPDPRSLMTTQAAADLVGLKVRAITRAIGEQRLPAVRIDGRWYIARADARHYRGDLNAE